VTREERLWEGAPEAAAAGRPVAELERWLEARARRRVACLGAPVSATTRVSSDPELEATARAALNSVRRRKDALELARMRTAESATAAGFAAVAPLIAPGRSERDLQIEIEAAFFRNGADALAFDTIVGGGPNSAVLHFPPSARTFEEDELVLIDAGAEYRGYASDVTRTYPASGRLTTEQGELHALVRNAELTAIDRCAPASSGETSIGQARRSWPRDWQSWACCGARRRVWSSRAPSSSSSRTGSATWSASASATRARS
jgi:Xaa-Pro aminopeptidase